MQYNSVNTAPVNQPVTYTTHNRFLIIASRIVWFAAAVIIALLALRFVFILLGANSANGFVDFIYNVSYPFAWPFFGIFGYSIHYGVSRVEFASLVGIVIYALIATLLVKLLSIPRNDTVEPTV